MYQNLRQLLSFLVHLLLLDSRMDGVSDQVPQLSTAAIKSNCLHFQANEYECRITLSISLIICRVSISCLKSSPLLKITYFGVSLGSAFWNTNHSGSCEF